MSSNVGPHGLQTTSAGLDYARRAVVVKAVDNVAYLRAAPPWAWKIHRHYFPSQSLDADPLQLVLELLASLGDYRDPRLIVEVGFNEIPRELTAKHAKIISAMVQMLHAQGILCGGPCWATGDYEESDWLLMRSLGWCGLDAVFVHAYWADCGLTQWNALRWRQWWDPKKDPKILIVTEAGRDMVRDAPGGGYSGKKGWHNDGVSAEQYLAEWAAFDAELQSVGAYAVGFTVGAPADWGAFEMDSIAARMPSGAPPVIPASPSVIPAKAGIQEPVQEDKMSDYQSPNHGGKRAQTLGVVVHSTRGGTASQATDYAATVSYFDNPSAEASAHAVVGPNGETHYPIADDVIGWHAREYNATHLGIEIAQPRLGGYLSPQSLAVAARIVAGWCVKYKIPIRWDPARGLEEHRNIPPGVREGKSDIGPPLDRDAFLAAVKREAQALAPKPRLDVGELRAFLDWGMARLQNQEEFRGDVGLVAFQAHLRALGCDYNAPRRYGWPG